MRRDRDAAGRRVRLPADRVATPRVAALDQVARRGAALLGVGETDLEQVRLRLYGEAAGIRVLHAEPDRRRRMRDCGDRVAGDRVVDRPPSSQRCQYAPSVPFDRYAAEQSTTA